MKDNYRRTCRENEKCALQHERMTDELQQKRTDSTDLSFR